MYRLAVILLSSALVVPSCARGRTVVNDQGEVVNGPRIRLALALNDFASGLVSWADIVDTLENAGELTGPQATAIRDADADVARSAQLINNALADASDDQTVLDAIRTFRSTMAQLTALVPVGARSAMTTALTAADTILAIGEQIGSLSYERGTYFQHHQPVAA